MRRNIHEDDGGREDSDDEESDEQEPVDDERDGSPLRPVVFLLLVTFVLRL